MEYQPVEIVCDNPKCLAPSESIIVDARLARYICSKCGFHLAEALIEYERPNMESWGSSHYSVPPKPRTNKTQ